MMLNRVSKLRPGIGFARHFSSADAPGLKTALYDEHVKLKGKMVEFAGYALPVQYPAGVKTEHLHTRENASIFDVSHMGQVLIHGSERVKFVERLVVGDIQALEEGNSTLSLITNANGGIIDDTVITKNANYISMVVNGACKAKDLAHMRTELEKGGYDASIELLDHKSLIALQGPKSAQTLESLGFDTSVLTFMRQTTGKIAGLDCTVTRCGYTGEDGFELSVDNSNAVSLMQALLDQPHVEPAGLGARDSLRLEAGLCLYGNDITDDTTPLEATLLWTIGKRRRAEGGFVGAENIIGTKPTRKRVGFVINKGPPARSHVEIYAENTADAKPIGEITSGTFSPSLGKPISMGYVEKPFAKANTELFAKIREKFIPITVTKMPFVKPNYFK